jgi:hypothetical protein
MPIPKMTARHVSAPQRSSAPKTENHIYLELYRLSSERRRVDSELQSVRARLAVLEKKRQLLDKQQRDLEALLGKHDVSTDTKEKGGFVLEY